MKKILLITKEGTDMEVAAALGSYRDMYPSAKFTILRFSHHSLIENNWLKEACVEEAIQCHYHSKSTTLLKLLIKLWFKRFDRAVILISQSRDFSRIKLFTNLTGAKEKMAYDLSSKKEMSFSSSVNQLTTSSVNQLTMKPKNLLSKTKGIFSLIIWRTLLFYLIILFFIIFIVIPMKIKKVFNR